MFKLCINLMLIICKTNVIEMSFVTVGHYPNMTSIGINEPNCGLQQVPRTTVPITFGSKCFGNQYNSWIYADNSMPGRHQKSETRIVKGKDTDYYDAPWAVFLSFQMDNYMLYFCTGTLITRLWILTSVSHCFDHGKRPLNKLVATAGTNKAMPYKEGRLANVLRNKMFSHPKYIYDKDYDLVLFKLSEPFDTIDDDFHYSLNTICLPERGQHNQKEETATFYGFGHPAPRKATGDVQKIDNWISGTNDIVLKQIEFTLKPNQTTSLIWEVPHNKSGPSTCVGDSGGPLVQQLDYGSRRVMVGMSKGIPIMQKCPRKKSSFVCISQHIDWILDVIHKESDGDFD